MDKTFPFSSSRKFRESFEGGLSRLLETGGMNLFILVCANASFEHALFDRFKDRLTGEYQRLKNLLEQHVSEGMDINEAEDDLSVFKEIMSIGFDAMQITQQRFEGPWEVQFNHLRSFRPMRNSQRPISSIEAPFDPNGFHFNKPFMQQETVWVGELLGTPVDLYYNKYPFVASHCLMVPNRERELPQYMAKELHQFAWESVALIGERLPEVRIGYNALGAFASVNHFHLQLFVRDEPLPVEHSQWIHNGGDQKYLVACHVFTQLDDSWQFIDTLNQHNQAYNLLYLPGKMIAMPRKKQGEFELAPWSNGFSWYELCGGMITFDRELFSGLRSEKIVEDLAQASLN